MEFAAYWQYTDIVTKFLFLSLITLSIVSWITGILRLYHSSKLKSNVASDLTNSVNNKIKNLTSISDSARKTFVEQVLLKDIARYRFEGEKGLGFIGTTAAIAPFIGLFGTVWGIFHALTSIGQTGQAGLSQVAGPVGEALIMTGLGLGVAIPAVIFYNIAVRMNRKTLYLANDTAYSLLADTANYQAISSHSNNTHSNNTAQTQVSKNETHMANLKAQTNN